MKKGLLRQMFYLQSQWRDFQNLNGVWKLKRFCITCIELIFRFCLSEVFLSLNFSLILIFKCIKPIEKALFSRFCLSEILVRPFIFLMAKFEVYNVLASKLKSSKKLNAIFAFLLRTF